MSGNEVIKPKNRRVGFFYIPLALEIFIGFVPFLILGSWYLSRLLGELTRYESGLIWITMEQKVEKEAYYLEAMMKDEQLDQVNLATDYENNSLSVHYRDSSGTVISGVEKIDTVDDSDDIFLRYIFYEEDGNIYELDIKNQKISVIMKSDKYYEHITDILKETDNQESSARSFYRFEGEKYYESNRILIPTKPICYKDIMLSNGLEGTRVLVTGRILSDATEQNADYFRMWVDEILIIIVALLGAIVCFVVFWSFRGLMKIMRLMEVVCRDNSEFPYFSSNLLDDRDEPEIRDLIENFQLMLLSIQKYQDSISSIREIYESLLPAAFLALFHREDIREIRPGDKAVVWGRVMSVQFVSPDEKDRDFFSGRNKMISRILDIFASMDMIVTELEYDRISALKLHKNKAEDAAFKKFSETIRKLDRTDSGVQEIIVTDTEGEYCYTVTGAPGHMAIRMEQIFEEAEESNDIEET